MKVHDRESRGQLSRSDVERLLTVVCHKRPLSSAVADHLHFTIGTLLCLIVISTVSQCFTVANRVGLFTLCKGFILVPGPTVGPPT